MSKESIKLMHAPQKIQQCSKSCGDMSVGGVLQSGGVRGLLVWLAVMATLHSKSSQLAGYSHCANPLGGGAQAQCDESGKIRVRGTHTANLVVGGLEFCDGTKWRAVCENGWGGRDATTACKELGFSRGECQYLKYNSMVTNR